MSLAQIISDAKEILRRTEGLSNLLPQSFLAHVDEATLVAGRAGDVARASTDWPDLKHWLEEIEKRIRLIIRCLSDADWRESNPNLTLNHLRETVRPLRKAIDQCQAFKDKGGR